MSKKHPMKKRINGAQLASSTAPPNAPTWSYCQSQNGSPDMVCIQILYIGNVLRGKVCEFFKFSHYRKNFMLVHFYLIDGGRIVEIMNLSHRYTRQDVIPICKIISMYNFQCFGRLFRFILNIGCQ